jgi:hypothetical protein
MYRFVRYLSTFFYTYLPINNHFQLTIITNVSFVTSPAYFVSHLATPVVSFLRSRDFSNYNPIYLQNLQKLHNKLLKQKTNKIWEAYRKQRNFVNKLKKKSVQKYFYERCAGGPKSSDFWPTIKPFLSSKGVKTNNSITLYILYLSMIYY